MDMPSSKAQVFADALPHLRKLAGSLLVLKYGGSVIEEAVYADSILTDLAFLQQVGVSVVVVHGGGKAISNKMREAGIVPKFINGLRYTDRKTISIVETVLTQTINPQIVGGLKARGARADAVGGRKILMAKKLVGSGEGGVKVDLGFVGEITKVSASLLTNLIRKGIIPVVTPIAASSSKVPLNINADIAAARVAAELKAANLIFLSDVNGILEDPQHPDSSLPRVTQADINGLRTTGVISGGMLPKVSASIDALKKGVRRVKFLNGQIAHCVLADLLMDIRAGTEIVL